MNWVGCVRGGKGGQRGEGSDFFAEHSNQLTLCGGSFALSSPTLPPSGLSLPFQNEKEERRERKEDIISFHMGKRGEKLP